MTDTSDPTSAEPVLDAPAELLCCNYNEKNQSLEQRFEALERKVDLLSEMVSQLASQQVVKRRRKPLRTNAKRNDQIRKAIKLFWRKKLAGDKVTREWAAQEYGLGASALSKKGLRKVMMEDIPKAIENAKAFRSIRKVDSRSIKILLEEVDKVLDESLK